MVSRCNIPEIVRSYCQFVHDRKCQKNIKLQKKSKKITFYIVHSQLEGSDISQDQNKASADLGTVAKMLVALTDKHMLLMWLPLKMFLNSHKLWAPQNCGSSCYSTRRTNLSLQHRTCPNLHNPTHGAALKQFLLDAFLNVINDLYKKWSWVARVTVHHCSHWLMAAHMKHTHSCPLHYHISVS